MEAAGGAAMPGAPYPPGSPCGGPPKPCCCPYGACCGGPGGPPYAGVAPYAFGAPYPGFAFAPSACGGGGGALPVEGPDPPTGGIGGATPTIVPFNLLGIP